MKIQLPTKKGNPYTNPEHDFDLNQVIVVVGANGSGKTRFGSKIEESNPKITHRISAQKSLTLPKSVSSTSKFRAKSDLYFGTYQEQWNEDQHLIHKKNHRWGGNYNTYLLNDYEKLMVLLHTEEYEESLNFKEGRIPKPETKLDKVQKIWEFVLPHRKLLKKANVIEVFPTEENTKIYNAAEMSDGERVIFYLIGQVICAPPNALIIIDEPEMHIHKSLIKNLFDKIENERPDCSIIYLTHDIDFAFTRQNATKLWAKSYEGNDIWDYEFLNEESPIPEQLYLEVLGSRNDVIFIEGDDNNSWDYKIFGQVFSEYTIKPLGGCEKVIQSVKAFNEQKTFHHINSFGLIDRDRRDTEEIGKLNLKNIWVLDVAEVENLFLIEEVIRAVALHQFKDPDVVFEEVKTNLINYFQSQLEPQILLRLKKTLRNQFEQIANCEAKNIGDVISEINSKFHEIDKGEIFESIKTDFEKAIVNKNYDMVLSCFNLKDSLIPNSKVLQLTGLHRQEVYRELVLGLLRKNDEISETLKTAIRAKIIGV